MQCKKTAVAICGAFILSCFIPTLGYASNKPKSRVNDFYDVGRSNGQWLRCPHCNKLHDRNEMIDCEKRSTQGVKQEGNTTVNNVDNSTQKHYHLHLSLFGNVSLW